MLKCPICNNEAQPQFEKHGYTIHACTSCQHQFIDIPMSSDHTDSIYDDSYFFEGGSGYDDYTSEADLLIAHGERYGKLLQAYTTPGTVFDVGAAAGFILKGLSNEGWVGQGIEPNDTMAKYARQTLELDVATGIFEQYQTDEKYDLVTMVQVIAHFYDVRKAIKVAHSLLKPDGMLLIETWDRSSWMARLFGENWHEYSPPSVVNWFSASGLTQLVEQFEFTKVATGKPDKRLNGAHAKSLVRYKLETIAGGKFLSRGLGIVPDDLQIPYPAFDLFWTLYRRS